MALFTEGLNSSADLVSCELIYRSNQVPILTRGVKSTKNDGGVKNRDTLFRIETKEALDMILPLLVNIHTQSPYDMWIALTIMGYLVPLLKDTATSTSVSADDIESDVDKWIKRPHFKIMPILDFSQDQQLYSGLLTLYYMVRFPKRTAEIQKLLSDFSIGKDEWMARATIIFTNPQSGHSVSPKIFISNPEVRHILPPYHAVMESARGLVQQKFKILAIRGMYVYDNTKPLQCITCQSPCKWQFAYKHCGCITAFNSCFICALTEWWDGKDQEFVKCKHCQHYWSIYNLLHVQGNRDWFTSRPSLPTQ